MSSDTKKEKAEPAEFLVESGSSPRVHRAEQFSRFGLELTRAEDLVTVGQLVKDFCLELWDWDAFSFTVRRGRSSRQFNPVLMVDTINGKRVDCTPEATPESNYCFTSKLVADCKPVLLNRDGGEDLSKDSRFGDCSRSSASLMFVPVASGDLVIGILSLQSYTVGKFTDADRDLLMKVANVVAPTLLRCRAEERMQEFLRLGERLNQVTDTIGVTRVVANTAANLLEWDFLSLHLCDSEFSELNLVLGLLKSEAENRVLHGGDYVKIPADGVVRDVLQGHAVAMDVESQTAQDLLRFHPFGGPLPLMSSMILAPIQSTKGVAGLLCLQCHIPAAYGTEEADIIRGLADYCSGSLERAWAQQNLKDSEENYRLLVENVNDGIVISQDDRFIFFNTRFAAMLGYAPEELNSRSYLDVYTEPGLEILRQRAEQRAAGKTVSDRYETLFRTKAGDDLPVEASVRIIQDYRGRKATFAVVRDIRERIQAEEKLRQSEKELRTLVSAMTDIIMVLDKDGYYQQHSSVGHNVLYSAGDKLAGKSVFDIFSHEKAEYFIRLFRRSLETRQTVNIEYDLQSSEGIQRWYNASISPLSDSTVLMVARDVTERRRADEELFKSNARYEALLDGSEDYIFVLDRDMRFLHVNSAIEKRFGIKPNQRIGKTLWEIYGTKEHPEFVKLIQQVFDTGKPVTFDDDDAIDGNTICTETVISPVFARNGEVDAVLGVSRDVTARRQAAIALKQSEQRYAVAVRGANDGIWDWNLETGRVYLSPRWWAIIGEPEPDEQDWEVSTWMDRIHPADVAAFQQKIDDHISGETPHLEDEHRIMHSDGSCRWVLCRGICVRNDEGQGVQMAGSISDITDRKRAEEMLHYGAHHDALTALPNRDYFISCLRKTVARARRRPAGEEEFAVLFLDLDRFKVINDSLGHHAGDELIIATARRLEECVRPGDLVARLGGDEFTVLLEDLEHSSDATKVAQRIIRDLSVPVTISGFAVQTTVSIGIAFDRPEYQQPEDLLRDADTAMYRAKATGRSRHQVFDQKMHDHAMELLQMEGDLRRAMARQEFVLYYQPVYELASGCLSGFEALIRWDHPEKGLILPGHFISLAEENGSIVPIGWWLIDQAARAAVEFNAQRSPDRQLEISINMSPNQFSQADFIPHIQFLLEGAGCAPSNIIFEITENSLMDDSKVTAEILQELRDYGIRLDLDDFGTGYSSLSFLRRHPLDRLKINQSFVRDIGKSEQSEEIISAIVSLARGLGMSVTAEGVETEEQLNVLTELKCDWAQGFFLHHPVPYEQALQLLASDGSIIHGT